MMNDRILPKRLSKSQILLRSLKCNMKPTQRLVCRKVVFDVWNVVCS